jgi:hypothetical protein
MEWDGKVSAPAPVCRANGASLQPGQTVYSGLRLLDGVFERLDYAEAAWATLDRAPLGLLSWWRRTIPLPEARQRALKLDAAVLTQLFTDLSAVSERPSQCFCYVIALLLVRIRRMKVLEIEDRAGEPWLVLLERGTGVLRRIRDPRMDAAEEEQVRRNLMAVISLDGGTAAAPAGALSAPAPPAD